MWLADSAPRDSESRALAHSFRYIRRALPRIRWIQSFADQRCGGWGVVYRASGFLYPGCHRTRFYELDGEYCHETMARAHGARKNGRRGRVPGRQSAPREAPRIPPVPLLAPAAPALPQIFAHAGAALSQTERRGPSLRRRRTPACEPGWTPGGRSISPRTAVSRDAGARGRCIPRVSLVHLGRRPNRTRASLETEVMRRRPIEDRPGRTADRSAAAGIGLTYCGHNSYSGALSVANLRVVRKWVSCPR